MISFSFISEMAMCGAQSLKYLLPDALKRKLAISCLISLSCDNYIKKGLYYTNYSNRRVEV